MRWKISVGAGDSFGTGLVLLLRERGHADVVAMNGDWTDVGGSHVVVLTECSREVARELCARAPDAVVVVAADDEQHSCRVILEETRFPRQRVIGAGGVAACARLRATLAEAIAVAERDVTGLVIGGRDGSWLPVAATLGAGGLPLSRRLSPDRLEALLAQVRDAGPPSAIALAAAVRDIVDAVVRDEHRIVSATAQCVGEYGIERDVAGVPVRLGRAGIEEIIEIDLEAHEREALLRPAG